MLAGDDEGSGAAWDAFVLAHPEGSFFHRWGWRAVIAKTFGHSCPYLTIRENGTIAGIIPLVEIDSRLFGHSLLSNAFCVGGGPLAVDSPARDALITEVESLGTQRGADYLEVRDSAHPFSGWRARNDLYAGFEGPLPADEAENLKQIPRKQRAVVRKALTLGFEITIDRSEQPFFGLYARNVRDHGTPALPRAYFAGLLSEFGPDCEILTVRRDGKAISSVLSFFFRGKVLPYYTGSIPEARALGANDMMYWALMRRAAERGCTVFDFGRSKVDTGPYHFKRNWGFEPRPITHQYRLLKGGDLPNVNPTNPRYALMIAMWKRLPIPVANAISLFLSRDLA